MSKLNLSGFAKNVQSMLVKHSPEILTGLGIAGLLTSTVLAVRETPKALRLIEDARYEKGEDLTTTEKIKAAWKPYIPAAVTAVGATACIIGASKVNMKRNAALATAYTLSETALKEYQAKVVETIGEKKEQVVRDAVAKERVEKNPVVTNEVIITDRGNTLCYDVISGRYFRSDVDKIKRAENELNARMLNEMYISVNEFYYEIGLEPTALGDQLGWNINDGLMEVRFSSQIAKNDEPCIVVDYRIAPRYDFCKLM